MQALGFIETVGLVAATEAADSALKSASVSLVGTQSVGSGYVTVILTGDVSAIKSAVEVGTESASAIGQVVSSQVIASPHVDMERIIHEDPRKSGGGKPAKAPKPAPTPAEKPAQKKKSPGV